MLPRGTFSTLACPAWSPETIIANARTMGYDGIEWRGGEAGHVNPDLPRTSRAALRQRLRDANLFSLAVTAYTSFVSNDSAVRAANQDELKQYLDLAADLDARYVRVFLGELGPGQELAHVYPRIVESLRACISHAEDTGVGMAIEHHDDFVRTSALVPILDQLRDSCVGAVWDVANAYSAGETARQGAQNLDGRIMYVQVKDGAGQGAAWRLTNVGAGSVPLREAVKRLREQNYAGAFSVEWEYAWHPELEPPERALPQAVKHVRSLLEEFYPFAGAAE
jgi:sugar phosphate isomerase/epimerase